MQQQSNSVRPIVLYVENNPDDLLLFQLVCRKHKPGFALQGVPSVALAIDYLQGKGPFVDRHQHPFPSLILLDYSLNGETGIDLLRWMREADYLPRLPVVMYSGGETDRQVQACYGSGAQMFIQKSGFKGLVELVRCLEKCLAVAPPNLNPILRLRQYTPPAFSHGSPAAPESTSLASPL
jgi:CheY-like chemotaxis protein